MDDLADQEDFSEDISRAKFEEICFDLFNSCITKTDEALKESGLDKSQIDEVILCGGSSKIPRIRKILQDFFNGKILNTSINPDEAVA